MMALRVRGGGALQRARPETVRSLLRPAPRAGQGTSGVQPWHQLGAVRLLAQLEDPNGGGGAGGQQQPQQQQQTPAPTLSPYRIHFSIAQVSNPGCRVPSGYSGAAKVAKFRVVDNNGPAANVTVGERFSALEDPYSVFAALRPNQYTTGRSGEFDDCYLVATRQQLPWDFRLKVEQNHLIGGLIASKQHITFTPNGVQLCVFQRSGNSFAQRCRRF
jgi:hypothetical protein